MKQVIVMRKDLGMRAGKMVAQGAHASMKVFMDRATPQIVSEGGKKIGDAMSVSLTPEMKVWAFDEPFTKVVCRCESEEELLILYYKAKEQGLPCCLIEDAGKTEFAGVPTYTCIAIGPDESEKIDKITGHLKLL